MRRRTIICLPAILLVLGLGAHSAEAQRAMEIPDLWRSVSIGGTDLSPDGDWVLYTTNPRTFPDRRSDSQIHLAAVDGSVDRQMTHWPDASNTGPGWHPSGEFFAFTSTRDGDERQIYVMPKDGGEARKVTDAEGGVGDWEWSHDGEELAFLAGRDGERQVWLMDGKGESRPRQLTDHPAPVTSFEWRDESREILFSAEDDWDEADAHRRREGYQARPIQQGIAYPDLVTLSALHLWSVGLDGEEAQRLTSGDFRVTGFEQAPGGGHVAFTAEPVDPHRDTRREEDVYLLDVTTRELERLTDNYVSESIVGFSPDASLLAIRAPSRLEYGGVQDVFVRPVSGGDWQSLTEGFDNDIFGVVWHDDGRSLYFEGGDGVNHQIFQVEVGSGQIRGLTDLVGVISLSRDDTAEPALVRFTDPHSPNDLYAVGWDDLGDRSRWTRLTRSNPWIEEVRLAEYETVHWTSDDGTEIQGLLVYPVDHDPARPYPLIIQIHGGPASAYRNTFSATHGTYPHVFAAEGYAVFQPNYRGSSHYGEQFKEEISGDYWTRATEDIHAGVDHLVERGIAHPDSLGFMGWSAGGHWSNWMLVTTDRFKAISTGAGVTNWISLYGQTDVQASREYYLGGDASRDAPNQPWDDFDHWWDESPLKHIRNASTPTLIHFGEDDRRIPMPQGQELHMALKQLGVPTEFMVYPEEPHGLREPRNQLVKVMSELGWFEKWIRGRETWFDWAEVLEMEGRIQDSVTPAVAEDAQDR